MNDYDPDAFYRVVETETGWTTEEVVMHSRHRPTAQEVRARYFGELKPCPFCNSKSEFNTMPEGSGSDGAMYVECTNKQCRASSALIYPLKDDVRAILIERWNRRDT